LFASSIGAGQSDHFRKYAPNEILTCFGLGFLGTFLYYVLLYYGYAHAQGLEVLVLQYTWPVFVVFFSWLILRERIGIATMVALGFGFAGVLVVLTKGNFADVHLSNVGVDCAVLAGAASFALFSVLGKKSNYEPFTATTLFFGAATVCSILSLFAFSSFAFPSSLTEWVMILLNGALINGLSYVLWLKALELGRASVLATLVFLTPVLGAIWIVALFGEPFSWSYLIGLVAVIGAGLIARKGHSTK
jgi:drug/metabolite transporter (DMT)-like permease